MRLILPTFLLTLVLTPSFSQSRNTPAALQHVRRLLKEKLHLENPASAPLLWQSLTGQVPLPASSVRTDVSVSDRSAEVLVHDDNKAESEIHAIVNPVDTSNLIVAAILQDPQNFLSPLQISVYYSSNFGQNWKSSTITFNPNPGDGLPVGGGDPVLAYDKNGKAYLSWLVLTLNLSSSTLHLTLYLSTSTNNGQTWSTPVMVDRGTAEIDIITGGGGGTVVDKQWMATDLSGSAFEGNLYVSYTYFNIVDSVTATSSILLKTKPKDASLFNPAVSVNHNTYAIVQFSSIDVDPTGYVHVLFFAGNSDDDIALYHALSTDGGASFLPEVQISSLHFPGLATGTSTDSIPGMPTDRLYPCPHLKAGRTPGVLFATWSANGIKAQETPGFDVWMAKSTDNGAHWGAPVRINQDADPAAQQYYPALTVSPDGILCISYYDRTEDPTGTLTHYRMTYSTDEGASFSPAQKVSTVASDFASIGALNGGFGIGEYTQIVATDYYAIPVWADGRANNGDIDIYAAIVPLFDPMSGSGEVGTITDAFSVSAPNPAAAQIRLNVRLEQPSAVHIRVFDVEGREVSTETKDGILDAGDYERSITLPPGAYLCSVATKFGFKTRRILLY